MGFKLAQCPNCGGELQIPEGIDKSKCIYCGSEIIVKEAIKITSDGLNLNSISELAELALDTKDFKEAFKYYNKIIEVDPSNYKVWFGRAISKGYMESTLDDLKIKEMAKGLEFALKKASDEKKNDLNVKIAKELNDFALFNLKRILNEFNKNMKLHTFNLFTSRLLGIVDVLDIAFKYNPSDKVILENIIKILKIHFFKKYRTTNRQILRLSNKSYDSAERKIREVERKIKRIDPNYKIPNYRL